MHKYISHTAKWGDLTRGPRVVNKATKKEMKKNGEQSPAAA